MDKFDRKIMVVANADLPSDQQGFIEVSKEPEVVAAIEQAIKTKFSYMVRRDAEADLDYRQPIPYVFIVNPKLKQVYVYKRSTQAGKSKLHNLYSMGVGGHVDFEETPEFTADPIGYTLRKEIEEETGIKSFDQIKLRGYMIDDSVEVNKYHIGAIYFAETSEAEITPQEDEMEHGSLHTIPQVEKIIASENDQLESWSMIIWPSVKKYLER